MKKLSSHMTGIAQGDAKLFADFENGGEMWTGDGPRERRHAVRFSEPFLAPPSVQLSASLVDAATGPSLRMDFAAENITRDGFEIVFRTWADSRIARIHCAWMAIGPVTDPEDWEQYL